MRLAIMGSGYVGLVSGACFAELGHEVMCIDNNPEKIAQLEAGVVPIYEPELEGLVHTNTSAGRLRFSTSIGEGVDFADILFICVGTPPLPGGGVDLSALEKVISEIASHMTSYKLIVEKSTVPVKTAESLELLAQKHLKGVDIPFDLASNPEFLSEGRAVADFMKPDRIVLGVKSEKAMSLLVQLYAPLNAPLLITDINSAELIKHASNAFLAMKISYANALSAICDAAGADINKVTRGIGLDHRIGQAFLNAGIGYGGSCFPKDVSGFIKIAESLDYDFALLKSVQDINQQQQQRFLNKVEEQVGDLSHKHLAILGLSFKPNTDDIREAPSLAIIEALLDKGASLCVYDPVAMKHVRQIFGEKLDYAKDPYQACENADAALFLTEWNEFTYLHLPKLKQNLRQPIIIDGRNIFEPLKMERLGFQYASMGQVNTQEAWL